ncbi:MAG TPA: cysteine desulfurase-like protein [Dongiaceae bacterium]|nr:cysteine desulfurase-like protein [Dongiaceae bacterium]
MSLDVARIRAEFPSLAIADSGRPRIYFDSPGGTQTPKAVIDRTIDCLVNCNANLGGPFVTSQAAGRLVDEAHAAMADLLGAASPAEIVFGQNMTTLTFHISRSIARNLEPGDEVIVTRMDHDANIAPWLLVAHDRGCRVRWLDFDRGSFEFDPAELDRLLGERTRVVALNYASNATGTINDVAGMTQRVRASAPKAMVYVDAVQLAPHRLVDVQAIGCDFLVCSPYKFFGPHQGVLWGRADRLMSLSPFKVRPADDTLPARFETGTLSHEGMAGTLGAVEYLAWVGKELAPQVPARAGENERRRWIRAAWQALEIHERGLTRRLVEGLQRLPGIKIQGITDPAAFDRRVPTVSFIHDRLAPSEMSAGFAREGIFVWDGHNYALEVITHLGLLESGGVLRVGLAHYNTAEEVDRLLDVLGQMIRRNSSARE